MELLIFLLFIPGFVFSILEWKIKRKLKEAGRVTTADFFIPSFRVTKLLWSKELASEQYYKTLVIPYRITLILSIGIYLGGYILFLIIVS